MYLGLLREGLISQLSHAAYIGGELAKAEAALHLDLRYRQDRPLTAMPAPPGAGADSSTPATPPAPLTLEQLRAAHDGDRVDLVFEATEQPAERELMGTFLEREKTPPFSSYQRTDQRVGMRWVPETQVVMGEMPDVVAPGVFRVVGVLDAELRVDASRVIVLSKVARVS
jgi:hypothetical protein